MLLHLPTQTRCHGRSVVPVLPLTRLDPGPPAQLPAIISSAHSPVHQPCLSSHSSPDRCLSYGGSHMCRASRWFCVSRRCFPPAVSQPAANHLFPHAAGSLHLCRPACRAQCPVPTPACSHHPPSTLAPSLLLYSLPHPVIDICSPHLLSVSVFLDPSGNSLTNITQKPLSSLRQLATLTIIEHNN